MAKTPKPNPNSSENKMKIKQKRKRSNSQDEHQIEEQALQITTVDTNDKSELSFDSLNLSEPTLKAINDMEFTHTTQVIIINNLYILSLFV